MFFLWMRDHPKLTRPATPFPTRRSSDLVREALAECLSKSPDRRDGNAFCRGGRPVGSYLESRASGDSAAKDQGTGAAAVKHQGAGPGGFIDRKKEQLPLRGVAALRARPTFWTCEFAATAAADADV